MTVWSCSSRKTPRRKNEREGAHRIDLHRGTERDGWWEPIGELPSLPGVIGDGRGQGEALAAIEEAAFRILGECLMRELEGTSPAFSFFRSSASCGAARDNR